MDGVPGISFPGILPNSTFTYRFTLKQSGTYWYHSHSAMQKITGMYGAIIVEPVSVDEFRFGPGETYDVIVKPKDGAYTIFAQSIDRTGFARGTLAERPGLTASVPPLDRAKWLTMTDMMGAMDHSAMLHGVTMTPMDHSPDNHSTMDHSAMGHSQEFMIENTRHKPTTKVRHAHTEYGPSTDMRVDMPRTNLDDPGIGLRNNGRRVLTLADLSSIGGLLDNRMAERELELHLTGNMERYTWSFDGLEFGQSTPVHFRYGERVRIILHNDTMMTHPMHLHGMWSELETPGGQFQVRRHTVPVQPAQRVSFLVTADVLGRWAWQRLTDGSLGLRMRYEFSRQFSPYLGVEWAAKFGDTKSMAEDAGKQTDEISWLAGIRFWF